MRASLWKLHGWLGLVLALPLSLVVISGALLVFAPEAERALHPERRAADPAAPGLPLAKLLAGLPGPPERVRLPREPGDPLEVRVAPGARIILDPGAGRVLWTEGPGRGFRTWLLYLHAHLLLGPWGRPVLAAGGLGLLALAVSGGPALGRGFWRSAPWTASRIHRALGFLVLPGLALLALTGTALVLNRPLARLLDQGVPPRTPSTWDGGLDLDRALQQSAAALPGSRATLILFPRRPGDPLTIRRREAGELHPNGRSQVYLDPATGEVLGVEAASRASFGRRLLNLACPLHIGAWGGQDGRLAILGTAGLLVTLIVSGLQLARRRAGKLTVPPGTRTPEGRGRSPAAGGCPGSPPESPGG